MTPPVNPKSVSVQAGVLGENELRVKVAELCGWTNLEGIYGYPPRMTGREARGHRRRTFDYPNSLSAAFTLCDMLADKGWVVSIDNGLDKTWECTFETGTSGHKDFRQHYAPHAKLATAICLASVKTMEGKSVQEGG